MTDQSISRPLSFLDQKTLEGLPDISYYEPDQLRPAFPEPPSVTGQVPESTADRLRSTYDRASTVSGRIERLKAKIDDRCSRFVVASQDGKGSRLYQAMNRLFGKKTTTVTYEDYRAALLLRQQLAEEDARDLRSK